MEYVGPPTIFRFTDAVKDTGLAQPYAHTRTNDGIYYIEYQTFDLMFFDGQGVTNLTDTYYRENIRPLFDDTFGSALQLIGDSRLYWDKANRLLGLSVEDKSVGSFTVRTFLYHTPTKRWTSLEGDNRYIVGVYDGTDEVSYWQRLSTLEGSAPTPFTPSSTLFMFADDSQNITSLNSDTIARLGNESISFGDMKIEDPQYVDTVEVVSNNADIVEVDIDHKLFANDSYTTSTANYSTGSGKHLTRLTGRFFRFVFKLLSGSTDDDETVIEGFRIDFKKRGKR
jgi:hypothetical protein